jgi:putative acyl-CoA dehydrogenase
VLTGAKAKLVGEKGKGVRTIATLFNITRIYNTISAVSYIRRAYSLSKTYSSIREAFGQKIENHLLHRKTLREMEMAYQAIPCLRCFCRGCLEKKNATPLLKAKKTYSAF